jgi:beta-lactam-binding protein with PASTA domain
MLKPTTMKTFRLILSALAMLFVMFLSAAITLRIALHGHEVTVPNFSGMTVSEASTAALRTGLDLNIENKFYSTTVPAGRMLSQAPASGSRVRHGWQVRVTESLGPQQVTIPDVAAKPLREASINLRRGGLDLGTLAHIDAPGDPDIVLSQTPPPNAGVDQPRVSLLLSSTAAGASSAIVVPSFLGMTYGAANHAAAALGLRAAAIFDTPPAPAATPAAATPAAAPTPAYTTNAAGVKIDASGQAVSFPAGQPPPQAAPLTPTAPATPAGPVTAQKPDSGYRITKGDIIRLTFGHITPTPSTN